MASKTFQSTWQQCPARGLTSAACCILLPGLLGNGLALTHASNCSAVLLHSSLLCSSMLTKYSSHHFAATACLSAKVCCTEPRYLFYSLQTTSFRRPHLHLSGAANGKLILSSRLHRSRRWGQEKENFDNNFPDSPKSYLRALWQFRWVA